ncbi:MAG TPA: class I SAM-dependent methyltransferase [Candidatus Aquilonibacter sp.]|nr:class I SAM-dependent methyltransferase [Candidatus Aquilonibacter sp.]
MPKYTFGDTSEASARLRKLAELYEPETRDLLKRGGVRGPEVAIDLGCGPGYTTRLLRNVVQAKRTIGFDASERFVEEARRKHAPELEFRMADVVRDGFDGLCPNAMLCRFLLTHLAAPGEALAAWAEAAAPDAILFIHETESLETQNPTLDRYYELVGRLQQHYGQALYVGGLLEAFVKQSGWRIAESERVTMEKPAQKMAELHLPNLRTWRNDEFAKRSFEAREIDALEEALARLVRGEVDAGTVRNCARQIIARRE